MLIRVDFSKFVLVLFFYFFQEARERHLEQDSQGSEGRCNSLYSKEQNVGFLIY